MIIEIDSKELDELRDKALRFDLDIIGIEQREKEAVELVELRAEVQRLKEELSRCQSLKQTS